MSAAPVNRIAHLLTDASEMPVPVGSFSDGEALALLWDYRQCPGAVRCPTCGPDTVEVLAFIEPEIDPDGMATTRPPVGEYAAALYCHRCHRAIGILPMLDRE